MKSQIDKKLAGFVVIVLPIGGLIGLAVLGWSRQERDYALTDAVGRRDIPAIRELLEAGASPHARSSGYSWRDRLGCLFQRTDLCTAFESYTVWDRVQGDAELKALMQRYRTRK